MKPLKVEAVKLYTEVQNRGCRRDGQKNARKESLESKLQLSLLTRLTQSPNGKFSLQLLCIFIVCVHDLIETAFHRNERYLFVTLIKIFCHLQPEIKF